jgi:hypothetical protein
LLILLRSKLPRTRLTVVSVFCWPKLIGAMPGPRHPLTPKRHETLATFVNTLKMCIQIENRKKKKGKQKTEKKNQKEKQGRTMKEKRRKPNRICHENRKIMNRVLVFVSVLPSFLSLCLAVS